jgi:hypothetical protein
MKAIEFPEMNAVLGANQPEYSPLPVHIEYCRDGEGELITDKEGKTIPQEMTCCLELSDEEIAEMVRTKQLFFTQAVFGEKFHPIRMSTQKPSHLGNHHSSFIVGGELFSEGDEVEGVWVDTEGQQFNGWGKITRYETGLWVQEQNLGATPVKMFVSMQKKVKTEA